MTTSKLASIATLALIGGATIGPASAIMPVTPGTYARLGQTVTVGSYRLTPLSVLEDSRCPARVACVWSGQVRLRVSIGALHGRERFSGEMTSMHPLQLRTGSLQILSIFPPKPTTGNPRPGDYRFGFQFTPRQLQDRIRPA